MKFSLALLSILGVFAFAVTAHSQTFPHRATFFNCAATVTFVAAGDSVDQTAINDAIADFERVSRSISSDRARTLEEKAANQVSIEISLAQTPGRSREILDQQLARIFTGMKAEVKSKVSNKVSYDRCYGLNGGLM